MQEFATRLVVDHYWAIYAEFSIGYHQ